MKENKSKINIAKPEVRQKVGVIKEDKIPRNRRVEDYDLGPNARNQVAKFDPEVVREALNERDLITGSLFKRSAKGFKNTLIFNTLGILIVYLVLYYVVHIFYVQNVLQNYCLTSGSSLQVSKSNLPESPQNINTKEINGSSTVC